MYFLVTGKNAGPVMLISGIVIAFCLLHYWLNEKTVLFILLIGNLPSVVVMAFVSSAGKLAQRMLSHTDFMTSMHSSHWLQV